MTSCRSWIADAVSWIGRHPVVVGAGIILVGAVARLIGIAGNDFVYYDEALYLLHGIDFLEYVDAHPVAGWGMFTRYLEILWRLALSDAKALWFLLAELRVFFVGADGWAFTRILSAAFGTATIGITYLLARRCFARPSVAMLSMALLAFLPSHVYYSRLGMQEALSTFCLAAGLVVYLSSDRLRWQHLFSGLLFACVFFTNYRMIIFPVYLLAWEALSYLVSRRFWWRRLLWTLISFAALIVLLGALYDGANTRITFAWMFHQSHLAKGHFEWLNLLSYPYYLFRLESVLFGGFFFLNVWLFLKGRREGVVVFGILLFHMLIFSFPQEKGVRYLCVMYPLFCVSVAWAVIELQQFFPSRSRFRQGIVLTVMVMFVWQGWKAGQIVSAATSHRRAIAELHQAQAVPTILSTQPLISRLYVANRAQVLPAVKSIPDLVRAYGLGYRYLLISPQAYISYTKDGKRFSPELLPYLNLFLQAVEPRQVYQHMSPILLERFVLEHNEDLGRSLQFLQNAKKKGYNKLYVYDIKGGLQVLGRVSQQLQTPEAR